MFVKSLETGQFLNIKVVSFKTSNPDSLEVKNFLLDDGELREVFSNSVSEDVRREKIDVKELRKELSLLEF